MTTIIGYTYMSGTHCPDCASDAWDTDLLRINDYHPHAVLPVRFDEHHMHCNLQDADGNLIHPVYPVYPVFDGSGEQPDSCSDCGATL